ncbi:FAD binding domain-containing protein [Bacillus sp. FJAT-29937]|uniref:FAD binding domain-containing protein n=1 Tax=Bacillus sp. FJAT-29937 TaxID=1720553 RepID=UPI00082CE9DD|nr:FAD binding domain-containing protein [Bacillus sp. FJAT-29937]
MIPFNFEYYRPSTIEEAVQTFQTLADQEKNVIYFSGGTEFITMARVNQMKADAVIDIKEIPDCQELGIDGNQVVLGAAVSLNKISETNIFPLLGEKAKQIADHTSRNKITLGGNLHSKLIYRESVLPLLLTDAKVKIAGKEGVETLPLADVFDKQMNMKHGYFLTQVLVDRPYIELPFFSVKKTKMSKVGYPIVSLAAFVNDRKIHAAFSGVCEFPFRSKDMESILNDTSISQMERIDEATKLLPASIVDDIWATAEYREFVFKNALQETLERLEVEIS